MLSTLSIVAIATFFALSVHSAKLPDTFERCKRTDPNLNQCLRSAIEKAIRDLKPGLPSLQMLPVDPLLVTKIQMQQGAGRPVTLKLDLNDAKTVGLSAAKINTIRADLDKRTLEADAVVPFSELNADYVMDGRFLVLPVKGKGKCQLTFKGVNVTLKFVAEPKTKNGKDYWNIVKFDVRVHDLDNFHVNFENLFNGDKALGDNTNRVLNENWKTFWEELRPAFEETFGEVFLQLSNTIFGKVPEKEIFLQ